MATILEQYTQTKQQLTQQINAQQFPPEQLMYYQELLYRINVLETCMTFCKTAPVTADQRVLGNHYRIVDAYLICLLQERRFGYPADPQQKAQREASHSNFQTIVTSFEKSFQSFSPSSQDDYKRQISKMINTILPAWLSYRNTYTAV